MARYLALLSSVFLFVGVCDAPAQTPSAESAPLTSTAQPVFKAGVDLVALSVTVTDRQQNYVSDLSQSDFAVFEDGVQQDLSFFAASKLPLDLAILLDTSVSMQDRLTFVQEAAVGFVRTLRAGDRGAVIGFNQAITLMEEFSGEVATLERAIRNTKAHGATALNNALYITLKEFQRAGRRDPQVRRRAIVVLSDGVDTASHVGFDEVLALAKRTGVSIYTIALTSKYSMEKSNGRRYFSQADFAMKTLAQETGAQAFFPLELKDLTGVYARIAEELAHQYSLGFTPKNPGRDGMFRRLVVRVLSRPDTRSRAPLGYIARAKTPPNN